jgi:ABC-type multidrug transport system fused ATPase/permease subunit
MRAALLILRKNKKLMNKTIKIIFIIFLLSILIFIAVGYLSSYFGWYAYKKWEYRKHSASIQESMRRGVFLKELNYKIDSFNGYQFRFEAFIERGFKWGRHSSDVTIPIEGSNYDYQFTYNYSPKQMIFITIEKDEMNKFDSAGGYLKQPKLSDTIILKVEGVGNETGKIKVW